MLSYFKLGAREKSLVTDTHPYSAHCLRIQEAAHRECDKHRKIQRLQDNCCIVALVGILIGAVMWWFDLNFYSLHWEKAFSGARLYINCLLRRSPELDVCLPGREWLTQLLNKWVEEPWATLGKGIGYYKTAFYFRNFVMWVVTSVTLSPQARELREQQQKLEKSDFSNVVQTSLNMIITDPRTNTKKLQFRTVHEVRLQALANSNRAYERQIQQAAEKCTPQGPDLKEPAHPFMHTLCDKTWNILYRAIINQVSSHINGVGYFLQCADKEVDVGKYWFGITCEKGEKVQTTKIRVMMIAEPALQDLANMWAKAAGDISESATADEREQWFRQGLDRVDENGNEICSIEAPSHEERWLTLIEMAKLYHVDGAGADASRRKPSRMLQSLELILGEKQPTAVMDDSLASLNYTKSGA